MRKAGNRVRITAQLINGNSDKHLWPETYERQLDDILISTKKSPTPLWTP